MTSIVALAHLNIAQSTFPVNGAPNPVHSQYAFINCTLHADADVTITNATLLIQDGKILRIGEKLVAPKEAIVVDLKGKHIYPAFIDLYSDYGMNDSKKPELKETKNSTSGWNSAIRSDIDAVSIFSHNQSQADELRKQGFATVLTSSKDGIVRGSGAFVFLANAPENESILKDKAAGFYSFNKGSSKQEYPSSLMGAIALLRQTYYDAQWYSSMLNSNNTIEYNLSLESFNKLQTLPSIFDGNDVYNDLRAKKVGDEFKVKYFIKGGGNEYQRLYEIQNEFSKFIIPVNFPDALDVEDAWEAEQIPLSDLKHWELAPANLALLEKNYISFCITSYGLKNKSDFLKNIRKAIKHGLSEKTALRALTYTPANFLGVQDKIGTLKVGLYANFFISNKAIFEDDAYIIETWSNGIKHAYGDITSQDISGKYKLDINKNTYTVNVSIDQENYSGTINLSDSNKTKASINFKNNQLTLSFPYDSLRSSRLTGNYNELEKSFNGKAQNNEGVWEDFNLRLISQSDTTKSILAKNKTIELGKIIYPFTSYGEAEQESEGLIKDTWSKFKHRYDALLIKNATIWTNERDSILKEHDVYVVDGKIVRIAPNIDAPKLAFAKTIDAKGMHLTPGIVDEHSHIALFSVNEGAEASSAEVRMSDVVNPNDINMYRQLAGGVTTAQLLHGSANPIGGQSCLIKLRWGKGVDELRYEKAPAFIKFALGENVKQANTPNKTRFPQTRMGVEQLYYDYFTRAKAYKKSMDDFSKLSPKQIEKNKTTIPRKDLDLDALVEILDNKRFITCHSYIQSEVNMLLHVADSMKFKVNTFTHILEGYKIADRIASHGANASTFSDWWAYKLEVMDAIPYNASMLTKAGVNTSINSDDAEMGRRLNQEAAKSIKYGGLSEVQALKLVTLNPAKMLHIDDKVGSIKVGKVADLVLWSDNPLSVYAKVNTTIIDGQIYYDINEDIRLRENNQKERARLISKLMIEKNKGTKVIKANIKKQHQFHCDSEESGW